MTDAALPDYRSLFSLAGKTVMLTGACGILGRHFAAGYAAHGADLVLVDLNEDETAGLADALAGEFGVKATGLNCDLADDRAIDRMAEAALSDGPVDVLHSNAATKTGSLDAFLKPLEEYSPSVWREIMAVNLDAMAWLSRALAPGMADRGGGSILMTASIYGVVAPDSRIYEGSLYNGRQIASPAVYSASKAGVIGLARHLAAEWGDRGVRVNCLTPGGVASGQNPEFQSRYAARVPMGRMAEPRDMVGAAVFLASDAARYVTGQNIVVDGGLTAW